MRHRLPNDAELRRLHEVAADYRSEGYKVVVWPAPDDLPAFVRDFRIDLLAKGRKENVLVQVRSRETLVGATDLARLAERIDGRAGWRLELVVAAAVGTGAAANGNGSYPVGTKPLRPEEIEDRLAEASELRGRGHDEAAFLLGWAAAEAAARVTLAAAGLGGGLAGPLGLIKTLYSYGLVGKRDYELLLGCAGTRDALAHGYRPVKANQRPVAGLLGAVRRLMKIDLCVGA